jgi:hypothetical protein
MLKKSILVLGMAVASTSAFAAHHEMFHGDVEVGYVASGSDSGMRVAGDLELMYGVSVGVDYRDYRNPLNLDVLEYGLTYDHQLNNGVSGFVGVSYLELEDDILDDDGFSVQVGAEVGLAKGVTFVAGMERVELDVMGDNSDVFLGLDVEVLESVSVSLHHREALNETGLSVRWSF